MRFEALIAAVLMLSQISAAAAAERQDNAPAPQFTAAETRTIGRNQLLHLLIATDPWLVREILDAVAERSVKNSDDYVARALDGIDRSKNPDIVSSTRTAAASLEWINLLRRAREEKKSAENKPKFEAGGRSAKGSVELLDVMRQAKKDKEREKANANAK
jgi:hypothetical protein